MGLREAKKERTRRLIADTAWRLFIERGFERVTVAEVARAVEVSEATVFNYFPNKEDLFYSRLELFGTRLVDAVATRDAGESALGAFRRFILDTSGQLDSVASGDGEAAEGLRAANRVIAESPALLAREQQAFAANADALARLFDGDDADPVTAQAAANALMGVHRSLIAYVRGRVLSGEDLAGLAAEVRERGERAFALLEGGLGEYGRRA